jgi:hypothetical protein
VNLSKTAKFSKRAASLEHTVSGTNMMTAQNGDAFVGVQKVPAGEAKRTEEEDYD